MANVEKILVTRAQYLPMKDGATLVIHTMEGREIQIVLSSPAVEDLARQLCQRNMPPSRSR